MIFVSLLLHFTVHDIFHSYVTTYRCAVDLRVTLISSTSNIIKNVTEMFVKHLCPHSQYIRRGLTFDLLISISIEIIHSIKIINLTKFESFVVKRSWVPLCFADDTKNIDFNPYPHAFTLLTSVSILPNRVAKVPSDFGSSLL